MTEADFIAALRTLPLHPGARGLADDAAVLDIGDTTLVLTHDMLVEGTHYLPSQDMADVAFRLVATNLSDLASKGAEPLGVLVGHMLGAGDARFVAGLHEALAAFDTPLLGGDTVAGTGARALGLTAIGRATHRPVPARSGAQVGDGLFVTGTLGAAMLGFEALREEGKGGGGGGDSSAYRRPRPRLAQGRALAPHVTAMMDVSDGLLLDAFRLAEASGVTLAVQSAAAPVAAPARRYDCLTWGDDYELLFTLPASIAKPPVPATPIGRVEPRGFVPLFVDGEPIANRAGLGYDHRG
ncbi:thiamine-phosphate kinase [Aurantiacibacter spongiae]|uniref:Thiamine-monophosphate kinase n=1 Tax=Aurantiacibacter spongiae TaxID=2488860 RepID=A0A3N5CPF7_9SPHN|nr:thiamine-phosphate kinase [Aurantiacibacter spongiae]RPF70864.1 thiamine-phosphate kinase [Aurantiacibacter spongiae]